MSYTQGANGEPVITVSYGGDGRHGASSGTTTLPVYQPLAGDSTCNGVYGSTGQNVTVPAGDICTLVPGTVVTGYLTDRGTLTVESATIKGNLQAQNARIGGNLQVQGGAPVLITGNPAGSSGYGVTVGGNLQVQQLAASTTTSLICATQVNGNLQWQYNAAPCPPATAAQRPPSSTTR